MAFLDQTTPEVKAWSVDLLGNWAGDPTSAVDYDAGGVPDTCEDCNGNGVADAWDTDCALDPGGCGTATDCQADHVPDECQVTGHDCNGNLVRDECDIAGVTMIAGGYVQCVP